MKLHEQLRIPLSAIDHSMADVVLSDPDMPPTSYVRDRILGLIRSGGKRLRPTLVLLGGRFGHGELHRDKLMRTAVLFEYLHMASLVHDDIIDAADTRRGAPALHRQTDIHTAALIADYMISRALEWSTSYDRSNEQSEQEGFIHANAAALASQLCIGEYRQMQNAYQVDITLRQYLQKTRQKTALLIASSLKAGAEAADAEPRIANLLYKIGDALGMAFQIQDDILDFTQSEETLGKPAGADLRNGNITLPTLYALQLPELQQAIRQLRPDSSEEAYREIVQAIADSPAIPRAVQLRDRYCKRTEQLIKRLKHHPAQQDLTILLEALTNRTA